MVAYLLVLVDFQVTDEPQKFHGRGNFKSPRRPYTTHQHKNGPKHGPNNVPSFAVPLAHHPPTVTPGFHTMVPISPIPEFAYQFPARPFLRPNAQLVKPGSDPAQAHVPPVNGSFQTSIPADSSSHDSGTGGRRLSANEQYGQANHSRNNQRQASNNIYVQQNVARRPYIRPPFFDAAGFFDGPNYPGICAMGLWHDSTFHVNILFCAVEFYLLCSCPFLLPPLYVCSSLRTCMYHYSVYRSTRSYLLLSCCTARRC